jgi:hypothetical protein
MGKLAGCFGGTFVRERARTAKGFAGERGERGVGEVHDVEIPREDVALMADWAATDRTARRLPRTEGQRSGANERSAKCEIYTSHFFLVEAAKLLILRYLPTLDIDGSAQNIAGKGLVRKILTNKGLAA